MRSLLNGDGTLERFVAAQQHVYDTALRELTDGQKATHWMWFIFPQLRALGQSETSRFFGIADLDEAKAYLAHPLLWARLIACCEALLTHRDRTARQILGGIDAMKLRSSMTLFACADESETVFRRVLEQFFDGVGDERTTALLGG